MSYGFGPANSRSSFLPSEFEMPEDNTAMRDAIGERENLTSNLLNIREIGQYEQVELLNAQTWFSTPVQKNSGESQKNRYGFRRTFDLVQLNNGSIPIGSTTLSVSPAITAITTPTKAFGSATIAGPKYVFFPNADINVVFDNSNASKQTLTITNGSTDVLTQCYVTIEYLKQG